MAKQAVKRQAKPVPKPEAQQRSKGSWAGYVAVALVCALVLFQGGYYAGATCVIGFVGAIAYILFAIIRNERRVCPWPTLALLGIAALYLISSFAHGATLTMLQTTATWFAAAGMSLWCVQETAGDKRRALDVLSSVGVVLAAAGIAMFAGLIPIEGAVNAGRLMFTFQYANTAGLFFAVIAVLSLCGSQRWRRVAAIVPISALLLTKSVGAIAVFAIATVVIAVRWVRENRPKPALAVGGALAVVAVCAAVVVLFRDRFAQAAQTFIERGIQMLDAGSLLATNPLAGIGPDQWQFAYSAAQTAQYQAADVHCSYLQVALDAGAVAALVLLAMAAFGVWRLARNGEFAAALGAGMIAVHALVDFDFQFSAIVVLTALLISTPLDAADDGAQGIGRFALRGNAVLCWVAAACALVASCGAVCLDLQAGALQNASVRHDAGKAVALYDSGVFMRGDVAMETFVASALYQSADFQGTADFVESLASEDEALAMYHALAQIGLGDDDAARETLSSALYQHPYNVDFYEAVRSCIVDNGLDARYAEAFNEQAGRATELSQAGHASWLSNQKAIEPIG